MNTRMLFLLVTTSIVVICTLVAEQRAIPKKCFYVKHSTGDVVAINCNCPCSPNWRSSTNRCKRCFHKVSDAPIDVTATKQKVTVQKNNVNTWRVVPVKTRASSSS